MSAGGGIEIGGNINTLGGVDITSPTDGQILIYVAATGLWVNANNTPGAASLAGLTDVTLTAPIANDFLVYNGVKWVNLGGASARTAIGLTVGTNVEAWSASLDALAALASTGLIAQTGANTFADRTITGTAGTITVTNGAGVAGNPTITIDATYVGQTSITTLGTISTGLIPIANGGTGQTTQTTGFDALSPLTTKGDLVVHNGTHNVRLPIGTDGYVLQANSAAPDGMTWVANPAGAYDTVENAGSALTQRNILNFSGNGITAADNPGSTRTDVALSSNLVDIAGLTPTANTVVYGNGTHFVNASTATTNTYFISKNGNDATGNGSRDFPYLTVGAACTAIGNATGVADFNDTTKRYYTIYIDAGIYVENVTVPSRPDVIFDMHGSVIQGTFIQDMDRTLLTGALNTAKVSVIGYDMRGAHSGLSLPKIGIDGAITMGSSVGANNFTSLYLINTGVTGNVLFSGVNPGYQGFLFTQNTNISGSINTSGTGVNINCYLNQAATSGTAGIGGCNGFVNLSAVNNINFNGPVITNSNAAGRLWNTVFKSGQAHNFTGSTAALAMDANTYDSYFNNVPTKGGETISLIDTARGVASGYVPVNYTATSTDVRGNLAGIDNALAALDGVFPWTSVAGTSQTLAKNNGYFATNAALTTFTLPAVSAVGDTYRISASGAGLFVVAQGAGQSIRFAIDVTTVGAGGSITATNQGDSLTIVCKVANTGFQVVDSVGNFNVV